MNPITQPVNPVAAVTHPDPYLYYARLAQERPLAFDPTLNLWVAAGLSTVRACLSDPRFVVRPADEAVPMSIAGTPLGAMFGAWARMRDGAGHTRARRWVDQVLMPDLDPLAQAWAARLCPAPLSASELTAFQFSLPVSVMAAYVGVADEHIEQARMTVDLLVRALGPTGSPEHIRLALGALASSGDWMPAHTPSFGLDLSPDERAANLLGLLFQSHTATAGLLGNALAHLRRVPGAADQIRANPDAAAELMARVARQDPAVHNTRRYAATSVRLADQTLAAGSQVLVVLAGADPDAALPFGHGAHACPGRHFAQRIATAGLMAVLGTGVDLGRMTLEYLPLPNARVPHWKEQS